MFIVCQCSYIENKNTNVWQRHITFDCALNVVNCVRWCALTFLSHKMQTGQMAWSICDNTRGVKQVSVSYRRSILYGCSVEKKIKLFKWSHHFFGLLFLWIFLSCYFFDENVLLHLSSSLCYRRRDNVWHVQMHMANTHGITFLFRWYWNLFAGWRTVAHCTEHLMWSRSICNTKIQVSLYICFTWY